MHRQPSVYQRLLSYLKPYWRQVILAYTAVLFAALLNLFVPQVIKEAIDNGLSGGEASALFAAGGIILGIALVRGLAGFAQRYYGEWLTHRVAYDLRNHFYDSVQHLPFAFHDRSHTGDDEHDTDGQAEGAGARDVSCSMISHGAPRRIRRSHRRRG